MSIIQIWDRTNRVLLARLKITLLVMLRSGVALKWTRVASRGSEIAEWLAHWLLVLEVPGSIPAGGEENLLVRTCFPSCHLQE